MSAYKGVLLRLSNKDLYKMLTIKITGNGYGNKPIDTIVQGYHFSSEGYFLNCKQINNGANLSACKFMIIDNVIALWIPSPEIYSTIVVDVYESNTTDDIVPFYLMGYEYEVTGQYNTTCTIVTKSAATAYLSTRTSISTTSWVASTIPLDGIIATGDLFSLYGGGIKVNRNANILVSGSNSYLSSTTGEELDAIIYGSTQGQITVNFEESVSRMFTTTIPSVYWYVPAGEIIYLQLSSGASKSYDMLERATKLTIQEV